MVISFNKVCFNGLHLANPSTWIWMVQFILYGLLQLIASGKPTSVGLDGPIHLYGLLQWIASGKPTSVGLDGPIYLYGLLQWIASGKPTSVGLDGSIHFIWVKNLTKLSIVIVKAVVLTGLPIYFTGICISYRNNIQYTSTIETRMPLIVTAFTHC